MSNLTERLDAYHGAAIDPPANVALVIIDTLRTVSKCITDLSRAVQMLDALDDLRADRIKDLQAQIDRLQERL